MSSTLRKQAYIYAFSNINVICPSILWQLHRSPCAYSYVNTLFRHYALKHAFMHAASHVIFISVVALNLKSDKAVPLHAIEALRYFSSSYSMITPTTVHMYIKFIKFLHIKTLKTLTHVLVLRPSSGSYIFLAKVTLEIVTY